MSTATVTTDTTVRDSAPATTASKRRALSDAPTGLRAALIASLVPVYYLALVTLPQPAPVTNDALHILLAVGVAVFAFLALAATGRFSGVAAPRRGAYLALSAALFGVGALAFTDSFAWVHWMVSGIGASPDTPIAIAAFKHAVIAAIHITALVLVARIVLPRRGSK